MISRTVSHILALVKSSLPCILTQLHLSVQPIYPACGYKCLRTCALFKNVSRREDKLQLSIYQQLRNRLVFTCFRLQESTPWRFCAETPLPHILHTPTLRGNTFWEYHKLQRQCLFLFSSHYYSFGVTLRYWPSNSHVLHFSQDRQQTQLSKIRDHI